MQVKITQTLLNPEIASLLACYIIEKEKPVDSFIDFGPVLDIYLSTLREFGCFPRICSTVKAWPFSVQDSCRGETTYKTLQVHIEDWLDANTGKRESSYPMPKPNLNVTI